MPFWQRFLILVLAILVVSFIFDRLWDGIFGFVLPSYVAGVVGGLAAVPIWALLKRAKPKDL
jgi:hypothetical protein